MIESKTLLVILEQLGTMLEELYQAIPELNIVYKSDLVAPMKYIETVREVFAEEGEEDDS